MTSYAYRPISNAELRKRDFDHFKAMELANDRFLARLEEATGKTFRTSVPRKVLPPLKRRQTATPEQRRTRKRIVLPKTADEVLNKIPETPTTMLEIIAAVAREFGLTANDLMGEHRCRMAAAPRFTAMHVLVARGASRAAVGRWLNRDHSTVINGLARFAATATPRMREIAAKYIANISPEGNAE